MRSSKVEMYDVHIEVDDDVWYEYKPSYFDEKKAPPPCANDAGVEDKWSPTCSTAAFNLYFQQTYTLTGVVVLAIAAAASAPP